MQRAAHCCAYRSAEGAYTDEATAAASETRNTAVTYDGMSICAAWHARSVGYTRSAVDVWGGNAPYLVSVPTEEDSAACLGHGVGMSQYGAARNGTARTDRRGYTYALLYRLRAVTPRLSRITQKSRPPMTKPSCHRRSCYVGKYHTSAKTLYSRSIIQTHTYASSPERSISLIYCGPYSVINAFLAAISSPSSVSKIRSVSASSAGVTEISRRSRDSSSSGASSRARSHRVPLIARPCISAPRADAVSAPFPPRRTQNTTCPYIQSHTAAIRR